MFGVLYSVYSGGNSRWLMDLIVWQILRFTARPIGTGLDEFCGLLFYGSLVTYLVLCLKLFC